MSGRFIFSYTLFILFFAANIYFWMAAHKVQAKWENVPDVPGFHQASMLALGDRQLAYRVNAMTLQTLGDTGGRSTPLSHYDFSALLDWFMLEDQLDPLADAVPMMATYYYGAVQDKSKLYHILDYLAIVGQRPDGQKWRWLGQAVFLAKHELNDDDKALELAYLLAANKSPTLGDWAKQMPVFILQEKGDTKQAYQIMMNILISNVDTMHPNEINYMRDYICNNLLKNQTEITPPPFCKEVAVF